MHILLCKWVKWVGLTLGLTALLAAIGLWIDHWESEQRFDYRGTFITGENGYHYANHEGLVACFDPEGNRVWLTELDADAGDISGMACAASGDVYLGTWLGKLIQLDSSGKEQWDIEVFEPPPPPRSPERDVIAYGCIPVFVSEDYVMLIKITDAPCYTDHETACIYRRDGEKVADLAEHSLYFKVWLEDFSGMLGKWLKHDDRGVTIPACDGLFHISPDGDMDCLIELPDVDSFNLVNESGAEGGNLLLVENRGRDGWDDWPEYGQALAEYDATTNSVQPLAITEYRFHWALRTGEAAVAMGSRRKLELWRDGGKAWELNRTFVRCAPTTDEEGNIHLVESHRRKFLPNGFAWIVIDQSGEVIRRKWLPVIGDGGIFRFDGPGRLLYCDGGVRMRVLEH